MADSNFVDYVKIYCRSGKGGKGSMHLRHVKYNPNGVLMVVTAVAAEALSFVAIITIGPCCT